MLRAWQLGRQWWGVRGQGSAGSDYFLEGAHVLGENVVTCVMIYYSPNQTRATMQHVDLFGTREQAAPLRPMAAAASHPGRTTKEWCTPRRVVRRSSGGLGGQPPDKVQMTESMYSILAHMDADANGGGGDDDSNDDANEAMQACVAQDHGENGAMKWLVTCMLLIVVSVLMPPVPHLCLRMYDSTREQYGNGVEVVGGADHDHGDLNAASAFVAMPGGEGVWCGGRYALRDCVFMW